MSGICSAHQGHDSECQTCNAMHVEYHFVPQFRWCVTHDRLDADHSHPAETCVVRSLFYGHYPQVGEGQ